MDDCAIGPHFSCVHVHTRFQRARIAIPYAISRPGKVEKVEKSLHVGILVDYAIILGYPHELGLLHKTTEDRRCGGTLVFIGRVAVLKENRASHSQ